MLVRMIAMRMIVVVAVIFVVIVDFSAVPHFVVLLPLARFRRRR